MKARTFSGLPNDNDSPKIIVMKLPGKHSTSALRLAAWGLALAAASAVRAEPYTILIYETAEDFAARTDAKRAPAYWAAFARYGEQLKAAGVRRGGAALQPGGQAHTVQVRAGQRAVTAGAFAKSPLHLGGYFSIDVPSLEAALGWAERAPNAATGSVEVRPAFPAPGM
jgi:hypothetical protein